MKSYPPEFFDTFGIAVFSFISIISIWALRTNTFLPQWVFVVLLIIGVLGLMTDGTLVYRFYGKKKK